MYRLVLLIVIASVLGLYNASAATYGYVTFDATSGATSTQALGINNLGQVAGAYFLAGVGHGYVRSADGQAYTTVDIPNTTFTNVVSINDRDTIVGNFVPPSTGGAYLRDLNGTAITSLPAGPVGKINNFGQVVGPGYLRNPDGTFTPLQLVGFAEAVGLNNVGQVVGAFQNPPGGPSHGFIYTIATHAFVQIDIPTWSNTVLLGINDSGQVVGSASDQTHSESIAFIRNVDGSITTLQVPGGTPGLLNVGDINNAGQVVGTYTELASSKQRGFIATPELATPSMWSLQLQSPTPPARLQAAMAFDSARNNIVLFGGNVPGAQSSAQSNDTWVWDGSTWTQMFPATLPPKMQGHAMATNVNGNGVILLPPQLGNQPFVNCNCFWVWNGTNWNQASLPSALNGRVEYAIAYDSARNQVVLFGGGGGLLSQAATDTWVWNGNAWTQKAPLTSPPARYRGAMAYDAARRQVILFGGLSTSSTNLNDTWVWDGANWQQRFPAASPSPRTFMNLSRDDIRSEVVLFGGQVPGSGFINEGDTWTWDGTSWAQRSSDQQPGHGGSPAMEYDGSRGQVVLLTEVCCFGVNGNTLWSGTWTWGQTQSTGASGSIQVTSNLPAATFSISPPVAGAPTTGPFPVTITNVPVGTYTVTFNQLSGYVVQQPTPQTQPLAAGGTITFTGTYQALLPGTIKITSFHPLATFSISPLVAGAPTTGPFPVTIPNVPGGTYMVTFNTVPGYTMAQPTLQTLNGGTIVFDGGYAVVPGSTVDTDGDGIPDDWEINGVPVLGQTIDLKTMGANPFKKDVFVEADWLEERVAGVLTHTHRPSSDAMAQVICAFANAPVTNPDSTQGIILHVDFGPTSIMNPVCADLATHQVSGPAWGQLSRGNSIPETGALKVLGTVVPPCTDSNCNYDWGAFNGLVSTVSNGHANFERFHVFHYAIFAHDLPSFPTLGKIIGFSRNTDNDFAKGSGYFIIALLPCSPAELLDPFPHTCASGSQFATNLAVDFMHELGHNLGLPHGGIANPQSLPRVVTKLDQLNGKPNYLSIMNYLFSSSGLIATDATLGTSNPRPDKVVDYSRVIVRSLDETHLVPADGLGSAARDGGTLYGTRWSCTLGKPRFQKDARSDIDWGCNGTSTSTQPLPGVAQINALNDPTNAFLVYPPPASDWSVLVFTGSLIGSLANVAEPMVTQIAEPTSQQLSLVADNPAMRTFCVGDVNGDGVVDVLDLTVIQSRFGAVNGDARFLAAVDVVPDGIINIYDLSAAAKNVGCKSQ